MKLFIAEKPSLALAIASALGSFQKDEGYYVVGDNFVTWCFGHILENFQPEDYDAKYAKWNLADLPIVPQIWKLKIKSDVKKQFNVVKSLIQKADEIVHAGDPDREGQLLVDEVLDFVGNKKPVKRIFLNALDDKSVKLALKNLQDNKNFSALRDSALGRSRADWLVGMNLSRAFSILSQRQGEQNISVGRVMTPTLALVVRREDEIKNFTPTKHFAINADFDFNDKKFSATWQIPENLSDSDGRLLNFDVAKNVLDKLKNFSGDAKVLSVSESEKQEAQPLPYSLSSLQIDAGKKYSYSPQQVLDAMQKLYELKFTTYPRSDCEFLPENQLADADKILNNLAKLPVNDFGVWTTAADTNIKSRAWNDKKISAHHAIIPTTVPVDWKKLDDVQQKLYILVAKKYLAQFFSPHKFLSTKVVIDFSDEKFSATGKNILEVGWKIIFTSSDDNEQTLPKLTDGDKLNFVDAKILDKVTKPPAHFTPSTLLQAMKEIYKFVRDDSLKQKLKDCSGIGTEATRAGIIEKLQAQNFLKLDKKFLEPTDKAKYAVKILPPELTFPDLTAVWENLLSEVANGKNSLDTFYQKQLTDLKNFVADVKLEVEKLPPPERKNKTATCPHCGDSLVQWKSKFGDGFYWKCQNKKCNLTLSDVNGEPFQSKTATCPKCGETLLHKKSKFDDGFFWQCDNKNCNLTLTDVGGLPFIKKCPDCGVGFVVKKNSKRGTFWSCSNYPACKIIFKENKNGLPVLEES